MLFLSLLVGISHAMNLEDLTAAGKALELVVRALHHPCGEGYRTYVSLGDVLPWLQRVNMFMQAWPYTQRFQNRTFGYDPKLCVDFPAGATGYCRPPSASYPSPSVWFLYVQLSRVKGKEMC